jgi:hypothetical protein
MDELKTLTMNWAEFCYWVLNFIVDKYINKIRRTGLEFCARVKYLSRVQIPIIIIGFFNWPNLSSRTMALGSTQPQIEMSAGGA